VRSFKTWACRCAVAAGGSKRKEKPNFKSDWCKHERCPTTASAAESPYGDEDLQADFTVLAVNRWLKVVESLGMLTLEQPRTARQ